MLEFYQELIENDLNPFMMFDREGKLIKYNKEAEFLLSYAKSKEIYDLAVANAPMSFGFKKSFITLTYERNLFYAILVGYLDEDMIGIKLYKEVYSSSDTKKNKKLTSVNIFTLINLSKASTLTNSDIKIDELYDPSIPDMKLNVEGFMKLLNQIFKEYREVGNLTIKIFLKVGETMIIDGKKYPICTIKFQSNETEVKNGALLYEIAKDAGVSLFIKERAVVLEFAML
jgi:hypothetical protein